MHSSLDAIVVAVATANERRIPAQSTDASVDWPIFSWPEPYNKVFSTGDGKALGDHLDDYLAKADDFKACVREAGLRWWSAC